MKIVFVRFLLVCWVLTGLVVVGGVIVGLIDQSFEVFLITLAFSGFLSILIMAASFTFIGVLNPKKLYQQIKHLNKAP